MCEPIQNTAKISELFGNLPCDKDYYFTKDKDYMLSIMDDDIMSNLLRKDFLRCQTYFNFIPHKKLTFQSFHDSIHKKYESKTKKLVWHIKIFEEKFVNLWENIIKCCYNKGMSINPELKKTKLVTFLNNTKLGRVFLELKKIVLQIKSILNFGENPDYVKMMKLVQYRDFNEDSWVQAYGNISGVYHEEYKKRAKNLKSSFQGSNDLNNNLFLIEFKYCLLYKQYVKINQMVVNCLENILQNHNQKLETSIQELIAKREEATGKIWLDY